MLKLNQKGLTGLAVVLLIIITGLIVGGAMYAYNSKHRSAPPGIANDLPTTQKAQEKMGTIKGQLAYPASVLPPQTVCAENLSDETDIHCTDVKTGTTYLLEVPAGTYYVYAKLIEGQGDFKDYKAYYNGFVKCGLEASCPVSSHKELLSVGVKARETVEGINPTDWYAL